MRRILKGFGILIFLGVVLVGFKLLPPHIQIRGVSPDLPSKVTLESFKAVNNGPVKISYINTARQKAGSRVIGYTTFVVEWEDGKILLIDLGMDEPTAVAFGEVLEKAIGADPAITYGVLPDFLGDDIERVKGVAFTHLHSDHVQGIEPVCASGAASITSIHTIDQMTKHNFHTKEPFEILKNSSCIKQIKLPDGVHTSDEFPGIGIFPLGGHTPGSTLFVVPVGNTLWLLSGDIANNKNDLLENKGKGFAYSYILVPEDVSRLKKLRVWLAELDKDSEINVVVAHDVQVLSKSDMPEWQASE